MPGQLIGQAGSAAVTLVDLNHLTATASFEPADAALLASGQPARITIPSLADLQITGRMVAVDPLPDPPAASSTSGTNPNSSGTSGGGSTATPATYTATIALDRPADGVLPGMPVEVTVSATANLRDG
jgi:multidrug resistance efflux pump